jgi:hypothetical protein
MKDLPIYLNDHLAGSIGAMQMIEDLIDTHQGKPLEPFLKDLADDIQSDQRDLKHLMAALGIEESTVRKAGAWVAEKASRVKLRITDVGEPNLALLRSLETLTLSIMGKRLLWDTLDASIAATVRTFGLDLKRLKTRAAEQFTRVEERAFKVARRIFAAEIDGRAEPGKR